MTAPRLSPEAEAAALREVGLLIRARRENASLSRAALARLTGISESTLKNLEAGRHRPTQQTLRLLLSQPELRLQPHELFPGGVAPSAIPTGAFMNSLLAPGYDPIGLVLALQQTLDGVGGTIEQSYLYLDSKSGIDWLRLVSLPAYAAFRELNHLRDLAQLVRERTGAEPLDVLGLGCGDGCKEVRLVQHLLGMDQEQLSLFLLDISPPLLGHAFKQARDLLPPGTPLFALLGDFHHLPFYESVLQPPTGTRRRRRLLCLFGGTFGNLRNEVLFVRNNLGSAEPGDLLLLHMGRVRAPRDNASEVARLDPHLSGLPSDLREAERQWLTGPIERFSQRPDKTPPEMEVQARFDTTSCPVPGSYAIEKSVLIKDRQPPRRFVVTYVKRYEPGALAECLGELGWATVRIWDNEVGDHLLCLFERAA